MKTLTILGSTGSIGTSTLDVIRQNADEYRVYALVAGQNVEVLLDQIVEFKPKVVVVATETVLASLTKQLSSSGIPSREWPDLSFGERARVMAAIAPEVDFVMSAIVGVAGMEATYEAVLRKKSIGLANKETLVASGRLVMDAVRETGTELIPVDSEHNGAHQCLRAGRRAEVLRLILTASGGPFRKTPKERFATVTPAEALNHPTWKMGPRITIDSATLMNKGFEVIEACRLFNLPPQQVKVTVHPQSTIHSLVEFVDGSILAQLSVTDMRLPILYALTYPDRIESDLKLDLSELSRLDFAAPDFAKFPCLRLAYEAAEAGGAKTIALNAADEVAVAAFLDGEISFTEIPRTIEAVLCETKDEHPESIKRVLTLDKEARETARRLIANRNNLTAKVLAP